MDSCKPGRFAKRYDPIVVYGIFSHASSHVYFGQARRGMNIRGGEHRKTLCCKIVTKQQLPCYSHMRQVGGALAWFQIPFVCIRGSCTAELLMLEKQCDTYWDSSLNMPSVLSQKSCSRMYDFICNQSSTSNRKPIHRLPLHQCASVFKLGTLKNLNNCICCSAKMIPFIVMERIIERKNKAASVCDWVQTCCHLDPEFASCMLRMFYQSGATWKANLCMKRLSDLCRIGA